MKELKRESEFHMYLQAGQRLIERGDLLQAEKILKSGLKKLDEHLMEQNQLRICFLSSLTSLTDLSAIGDNCANGTDLSAGQNPQDEQIE